MRRCVWSRNLKNEEALNSDCSCTLCRLKGCHRSCLTGTAIMITYIKADVRSFSKWWSADQEISCFRITRKSRIVFAVWNWFLFWCTCFVLCRLLDNNSRSVSQALSDELWIVASVFEECKKTVRWRQGWPYASWSATQPLLTRIVEVGIHTVLTSAIDEDGPQLYAPASLHAAIELSVPNERDPGAVWTL